MEHFINQNKVVKRFTRKKLSQFSGEDDAESTINAKESGIWKKQWYERCIKPLLVDEYRDE
ncbi:hypothetical protein [Bacillus sp. FJAT-50079]|uniref:hypothetical protein n=1 Tax=Bacillus sp. FJAT-50079 TaxID=2833577 RepID=UPI001BC9D011|nr:hypothetical protein [Bacillus sp. FJAT-50079]MBS4208040.1 hypothetical protein [Bacillus sp. FJAT-50079]